MHKILTLFFVSLALLLGGCEPTSTPSEPVQEPPPSEPAKPPTLQPAAYPSFADVVQRVRPAVVNIYTRSKIKVAPQAKEAGTKLVPRERIAQSLGSGFILTAEGLVLTNYHVIKGATKIDVRLLDERKFAAHVVGEDPKTDVALLKIEGATDLPSAPLADSDKLRVGEWVLAIGNPLGLTSTVTAGIASATGRRGIPSSGDLRYQDFIQTDTSINRGNSGGPLINARGEVVGINSAVASEANGIGFAIPINMVKELLPKLEAGGRVRRAFLGVYADEIPDALRPQINLPPKGGALVKKVFKGGPADQAKIRPGDVILSLGTEAIDDPDELAWVAGNHSAGDIVDVAIKRGGKNLKLQVQLGKLPNPK